MTYEDKDQSFWGGVNCNRFPTPKITGQVKSVVGVAEVEQESSTRKGAGRKTVRGATSDGVFFGGTFR